MAIPLHFSPRWIWVWSRAALALAAILAGASFARAQLTGPEAISTWAKETLRFDFAGGDFVVQTGGQIDSEVYFTDQRPQGLVLADDQVFFQPRATWRVEGFWRDRFYFLAKLRWDRGFDPGGAPEGQRRADVWLGRVSLWPGHLDLQAGVLPTVFGNWVGRHEAWENPFISAPVPYENVTTLTDQFTPAGYGNLLARRDLPDVKQSWLPVLWGPAYTPGYTALANWGDFSLQAQVAAFAISSRPAVWDQWDFRDPTTTVRLGWNPAAAWRWGLSYSTGAYLIDPILVVPPPNSGLPAGTNFGDYRQRTWGLDLAWAHRRWQVWSEAMLASWETPRTGTLSTFTYYVEGRYKLSPEWSLAARWNQQFFSRIPAPGGRLETWDYTLDRLELAATWRPSRVWQLKAQYSFNRQASAPLQQGQQFLALQGTWRY